MAIGITAYVADADNFYSTNKILSHFGFISFFAFLPLYILTTIVALKIKAFTGKLIIPMVIMISSLVIVFLKIINATIGFVITMVNG